MAKKNNIIAGGLQGLLAPAAAPVSPQEPTQQEQAPKRVKGDYKTVCYSIPPELAEKIRYIAYWDRKKLNAVVVEAFTAYCDQWKPDGAKPKKF